MNPISIVFPLPFDNWETYKPWVEKFCKTFREFPPEHDYLVYAVCNLGSPTDAVREMFYGIRTKFVQYDEFGCDIGSAQLVARFQTKNTPVIGMTSRCFFHRKGWLSRMMEARNQFGSGLYLCSASKESGSLHACTRAYMMDSDEWNHYPEKINHRTKGPFFETGAGNPNGSLLDWHVKHVNNAYVVHWDSVFRMPDEWYSYAKCENRFRNGNQEQMLVFDGHSQSYSESDPDEKARLENLLTATEPSP